MRELGGVGVALVTPLRSDYSIDFTGLERLLSHVIQGGVDYLVVQGTTGESPVFTWSEKLQILEFIIEKTSNELPIVFGLGGNNSFDLIEKSTSLKDYPLAAILSTSPYYSRPSQQGLLRHYQLLGDAFPHPVILYNVPARTASNMEASTTLSLASHPNIIGMKEASGDMQQCQTILENRPSDFLFLSGNDHNTFELVQLGAEGVISVIANLLPSAFKSMVTSGLSKDHAAAAQQNDQLQSAYELANQEGNPSSVKAGLEAGGICTRTVKPPLFDGSDELVSRWQHYLRRG